MAVANTVTTLNGLFKVVYADKIQDLVPDFAILQKAVDFVPADKETGNYYAQPVALSHEGGFSYNGSSGDEATLNEAVSAQMKEAQVVGSEIVLRTKISYGALARASTQGPKAFRRASAWKVEDMNDSMRKRLEISLLYGQLGLGIVETNTTGALVITAASWAPGIWVGMEGSILEAWTTVADSSTQHDTDLTISAVDTDTRTVTVTGTSTAVVANDILYFKGSRTSTGFNEMAGVRKIITNTGTLFNISAATFSLWKGTTYSAGSAALTHAKLQEAISKAVSKGLMEKLLVLVSPKVWGSLNSDQAALRVFDSSYKPSKGENGFEGLTFHATNGIVEIKSHPMVRDGDAFLLPIDSMMRIGATDVTFGVPGMEEQFFTLVPGKSSVELQCLTDQAVFIEKPGQSCYISGIA